MHRMTPLQLGFRGHAGGGKRKLIDQVEDKTTMQESQGTAMHGESRKNIEAPQNYGFTSVVADAVKDKLGSIMNSAEGFMSAVGGASSFAFVGIMDDRRHRLKNLAEDAAKGASAMFGLKEWGQQFLISDKGMFITGNAGKTQKKADQKAAGGSGGGGEGENFKIRLALVENKNGKKQTQQAGQPKLARTFKSEYSGVEFDIETFETSGGSGNGGSGGSSEQGSSKPTGQKSLHKEESKTFYDMTEEQQHILRGDGNVKVKDKVVLTHWKDDKKSTRCDDKHVHVRWEGNQVWVDKDGCWSSKPIQIRKCDDPSARAARRAARSASGILAADDEEEIPGPILSGPPAYYADAPLSINNEGELDLAYKAPLIVDETDAAFTLAYKAPLFIDVDGKLTSTSGEGVQEAPSDNLSYGRRNAAWVRCLAITGDILDGGTF